MIVGIGIDLIEIARIAAAAQRWGDRFTRRVFTPRERSFAAARADCTQHLAARFAAKEAFLKALGVGYSQGVRWKDIEVISHVSGRPEIQLRNRTKALSHRHGVNRIHLSMSHDGTYGFVQVILEV